MDTRCFIQVATAIPHQTLAGAACMSELQQEVVVAPVRVMGSLKHPKIDVVLLL